MPFKKIEVTRPRGINSDLSPYEMPNELWSNGNNVDFKGARVNVALGYQGVLTANPLSVIPKHAVAFKDGSTDYWYYAGDTKIYKTDGTNHTNVTRASSDYTPEFDITYDTDGTTVLSSVRQHSGWTSNVFNGALLLNNGYDLPQVYSTNTSTMIDLTAWPSTDRCGVLRPFKNYLVALDVTEGSNRRPTMVKWSDTAPLGEVPASWTAVDASSQAVYWR